MKCHEKSCWILGSMCYAILYRNCNIYRPNRAESISGNSNYWALDCVWGTNSPLYKLPKVNFYRSHLITASTIVQWQWRAHRGKNCHNTEYCIKQNSMITDNSIMINPFQQYFYSSIKAVCFLDQQSGCRHLYFPLLIASQYRFLTLATEDNNTVLYIMCYEQHFQLYHQELSSEVVTSLGMSIH